MNVSYFFKPQSKKGNINLINSIFKTAIINITFFFHHFAIVITPFTSSSFIFPSLLVWIIVNDQNNDDVNISTDQFKDIIPVEFQREQSEEISEKGQLRKKESFESQGIK